METNIFILCHSISVHRIHETWLASIVDPSLFKQHKLVPFVWNVRLWLEGRLSWRG
ncbi:hypothetical protein TorRG33x02_212690, partial [Trema orientale]